MDPTHWLLAAEAYAGFWRGEHLPPPPPAALFYRHGNGINVPSLGKKGVYWPKLLLTAKVDIKQIYADATMMEVNREQMLLLR